MRRAMCGARRYPSWMHAALVVVAFFAARPPAEAIAIPQAHFSTFEPASGAVLPLNAVVFGLRTAGVVSSPPTVFVSDSDDPTQNAAVVVGTIDARRPADRYTLPPLVAGTAFTLDVEDPNGGSFIAGYSIGALTDDDAPVFDGADDLVIDVEWATPFGGTATLAVTGTAPVATDDHLAVYVVERSIDGGDFAALAVMGADEAPTQVAFTDALAEPAVSACWRVRALDAGGNEALLDSVACATTPKGGW